MRNANETRGRESEASRGVVLIRDVPDVIERPKPLAELGPEEAEEWIALCNAVPATYFPPATYMTLAAYCRHVVIARHLAQLVRRAMLGKKLDVDKYVRLVREHRAEETAVIQCLRAMRLTHLANYEHDRTPLPEATPKPWLS